jgi:O-antigen ligase
MVLIFSLFTNIYMQSMRPLLNPYFFLCIFFVVSSIYPWSYAWADGYHNHQRLVQVSVLILTAVMFVISGVNRRFWLSSHCSIVRAGLLLFLLGGALSVWFSALFFHALFEYLHWLLLLVFACATAAWAKADKKLLLFLGVLVVVQALGVFIAILYLLFAFIRGEAISPEMIYPGVQNIRTYNQIQIFVIPLWVFLLQNRRFGLIAFILLCANFLLLFIGGGRGVALVLLLLFVGMLCFAWYRPRIYKTLVALAIAGGIYQLLMHFGVAGMQDLYRAGSSGRLEMWLEIIYALNWKNLFFGIGPNGYVLFTHKFLSAHPHNSVLQLLLEWGGIALLGAGVVVARILYVAGNYIAMHKDDELTQALCAVWIAALAYSLFDGVIVMPIAQTLIVMFAALIWGRVHSNQMAADQKALSYRRLLCASGFVLLVCMPYMWLGSRYYLQQMDSEDVRHPRIWVKRGALNMETEQ